MNDGIEDRLALLLVASVLAFAVACIVTACGDASNGIGSPDSCDVCHNVVSGADAGDAAK